MTHLAVTRDQDGRTLGAFVKTALNVPWSRAKELISTGRVLVNSQVEKSDAHRLKEGAQVEIRQEARRELRGVLSPTDLVYFDSDVAVVRKRAGVLTVPFEDERDTLVDQARALLLRIAKSHGKKGSAEGLGVVQRLDKDTTGLLVFARSHAAKRGLDEQIRAHTVERLYVALVHGVPRSGTIRSDIVQDRGDGLRGSWGTRPRHVGPPPEDAKSSATQVRVLESLGTRASLIECKLETGRQHQIRIHLSESGCPLIGEPVYIRDFDGPRIEAPRPMLHAKRLGFVHPRSQKLMTFDDPMPEDFARQLAILKNEEPKPEQLEAEQLDSVEAPEGDSAP